MERSVLSLSFVITLTILSGLIILTSLLILGMIIFGPEKLGGNVLKAIFGEKIDVIGFLIGLCSLFLAMIFALLRRKFMPIEEISVG
ncbi:MAG: hypothetical protein ACE5K4_08470 [Candidatus Hydrothermarchaeota archaeon]